VQPKRSSRAAGAPGASPVGLFTLRLG
jgi:hypothetical protein